LLRIVWVDTGRRTLKYHQTLDERLGLEPDERALITVLLLRGAQAPGELRTRTERLHKFDDRTDVEACLRRMAARPEPLVRELERRPGQHDRRWIHLLGPVPEEEAVAAVESVDRDTVIADGAEARDARVRSAYDAVATAYADELLDELDGLPFERWLLDRVVAQANGLPVVEVGSGPGHITAYLAEYGVDATGVDISPEMVAEARRRFPERTFEVGDLRRLGRPPTSSGWAAVLAWYSLIHLAASELPDAIAALTRPLDPGGWLVLALHAGAEVRHVEEFLGHEVNLDYVLYDPSHVVSVVEAAGLVDVEWYLRGPIAGRGETTRRLYVIGRSPS
jgi:SAM-dependent methyltransferase